MERHQGWKVAVNKKRPAFLVEVWVYQNISNGRRVILQPDGSEEVFEIDVSTETEADPTFCVPIDIWEDVLLPELREYIDDSPNENYTEGKLEATENHLEDMQKLVFNEKDNHE